MMYVRCPLSLRNVEDLLAESGLGHCLSPDRGRKQYRDKDYRPSQVANVSEHRPAKSRSPGGTSSGCRGCTFPSTMQRQCLQAKGAMLLRWLRRWRTGKERRRVTDPAAPLPDVDPLEEVLRIVKNRVTIVLAFATYPTLARQRTGAAMKARADQE